jgi:hypothetical protein
LISIEIVGLADVLSLLSTTMYVLNILLLLCIG